MFHGFMTVIGKRIKDVSMEKITCLTCSRISTNGSLGVLKRIDMFVSYQRFVLIFRCKICERDFDRDSSLVTHMEKNHIPNELPYSCPVCGYRASIFSLVVDHFLAKHAGENSWLSDIVCLIVKLSRAN